MSRSRKGKKAPGFDCWSRRPHSGNGYGGWVKKFCKKTERMRDKELILKELKQLTD